VSKSFAGVRAVDAVSFAIDAGEFFALLGPSGCGKTTTLRLLAGFERPDSGEIHLGGRRIDPAPPYERDLGMVFQNYALFPHLSVERNVAFGLEQRRVARPDITRRVGRALEMVRLPATTFGARKPAELSGGQKQRVALARALVLEPKVLLLDEPLGALDFELRREMQRELKALHRDLGTTFVFVTHDQEEALMLSDRVAVMHRARIAELGTPAALYDMPRTRFVAAFLGGANFLAGRVAAQEGSTLRVATADGEIVVATSSVTNPLLGAELTLAVRPEKLRLAAAALPNRLTATLRESFFRGDSTRLLCALASGAEIVALARDGVSARAGDRIELGFDVQDVFIVEERE
jgi:ABC-type Fe3+/spermidine/putrescine transport system ATPase subunit